MWGIKVTPDLYEDEQDDYDVEEQNDGIDYDPSDWDEYDDYGNNQQDDGSIDTAYDE